MVGHSREGDVGNVVLTENREWNGIEKAVEPPTDCTFSKRP